MTNVGNKEKRIKRLIQNISKCPKRCKNMSNIIAGKPESGANGIGYWSDAFPYYNAKLIVVGQDWGNVEYVRRFKFPRD